MRIEEGGTILQVKNLQVTYKHSERDANVLNQLSFELRKGEILALLGESGSGKTTVAKAVAGLLPPSAQIGGGTLQIGGLAQAVNLMDAKTEWDAIRGRQVAMLFQDARQALNPVMKIKEHFKETLLFHRMATADQAIRIASGLLSRLHFKNASTILECYPHELSGGMCQRICLALALCLKPKVLIADEPTSALDTVSQKEVLDLLKSLQEELGLSVLLITHDIAVANAISNRVIVLHRGAIEEVGDTKAVFSRPQAAYTRELLASRSRIAEPSRVRRGLQHSEPLLEVDGLEKAYPGKKRVLHNIHLAVGKGEIVGLLGQSGCGKSTLAKCITGLETPSGGLVLYQGSDMSRLRGKRRREMRQHIQLVFQDARASLNPARTALELVQEPLRYLKIGGSKEREETARYYLHEVGIGGDALHRRPPQLSTGQCQRIAIARALALRPQLLICDEAVSALDMKVQVQIVQLLRRLHIQFDFSILMISHDIRVLQFFCSRIAVMENGTISEVRSGALLHESEQSYTQLLLKCAGDLEEGL